VFGEVGEERERQETDSKQMDEKWGFGGEANGSNVEATI
jgi:hypothetical protein